MADAADSFYRSVFAESVQDLYQALPRLARKAGSLLHLSGNGTLVANATLRPAASTFSSAHAAGTTGSAAAKAGFMSSFFGSFSWSKLSNLDGVFSYIASRWALSTFMIAIVLNRAHVYSAPRRHVQLNWQTRFGLRVLPIACFLYQIVRLLQATRCQAGDFIPRLVHRGSQTVINNAFAGDSGFLYKLSAGLLFWQDDAQSCHASGMVPPGEDKMAFIGSATVLWPLFLTICLSHLVETVCCSLEGRQPMAETGMTIFEHSLAFAEAEAVVRGSIGMGLWGMPSSFTPPAPPAEAEVASESAGIAATFTRDMIMTRLNVPPEVMLIGLISCASHISNHGLAILGVQSKCRLVNTSVWGLCYMTAFAWSFWKASRPITDADLSVLRYPTVCIIGFVPHLLIMAGIFICGIVYSASLVALAVSSPDAASSGRSFRERLRHAFNNMQANSTLANIHISWHEEFYTTLLKVGFTMLTMASQAVYFNEGTAITVAPRTFVEEERIAQLAAARALSSRMRATVPPELQGDHSIADGVGLVEEPVAHPANSTSGYARERRTAQKISKAGMAATREDGVGGHQRSGRWFISWKLMHDTLGLLKCCVAKAIVIFCGKIGVAALPQWLTDASRWSAQTTKAGSQATSSEPGPSDGQPGFRVPGDSAELVAPTDLNTDVEAELRRRLTTTHPTAFSEQLLADEVYEWWKGNGWMGELDGSGDYQPVSHDDDLTSLISESDAGSAWETDSSGSDADDGGRTPTRADHRETPLEGLARLLHPQSLEERQQARLLAQRLARAGPMTRSQYRRSVASEDAQLLLPPFRNTMSPAEQEDFLELLIKTQRDKVAGEGGGDGAGRQGSPSNAKSWATGAAGMGDSGPQCVVCHDAARTIIAWPCRCLSTCEPCRISLALNNYSVCVCCRRDVSAFSRLFVP